MANASETRVPCACRTKERLRQAKRGGETYDNLFRKMLAQYDPQQAGKKG